MLTRDVDNITTYYSQFAPQLLQTKYANEMWSLYQKGKLTPDTQLTGHFDEDTSAVDVDTVLEEIKAAFEQEQERLERINDANTID